MTTMCLIKVQIIKDFSWVVNKLVMLISLGLKILYQVLLVVSWMLDDNSNFCGQEIIDNSMKTFMKRELD